MASETEFRGAYRPRLLWDGKLDAEGNERRPGLPALDPPPRIVLTQPASHNGPSASGAAPEVDNVLYCGDSLYAAAAALHAHTGAIQLIYIDPPFDAGVRFTSSSQSADRNIVALEDRHGTGEESYHHKMFVLLSAARLLLHPTGSIYLHCDWRQSHYLRLIMDEVFGADCFQNEIAWCYREAINSSRRWNRKHDTILFYSREPKGCYFSPAEVLAPHAEATRMKYRRSDENGRYRLMGRGIQGSPICSARDVADRWELERPDLVYRQYLREGTYPVDYWNIDVVNQAAHERTGYATQKPEALLERIIRASSRPGDMCADLFCGSGTLPAVAAKLGRRWIGADASPVAIQTARRRLSAPALAGLPGTGYRLVDLRPAMRGGAERLPTVGEIARRVIESYGDSVEGVLAGGVYRTRDGAACVWRKAEVVTAADVEAAAFSAEFAGAGVLRLFAYRYDADARRAQRAARVPVDLILLPPDIGVEPQFFEAGRLTAAVEGLSRQDVWCVRLTDWAPSRPSGRLSAEVAAIRSRAADAPFDYLESWAIDTNYSGERGFRADYSMRGHKGPPAAVIEIAAVDAQNLCVMAEDVFGNFQVVRPEGTPNDQR